MNNRIYKFRAWDKIDSRIGNLELWNTMQPAGQRVRDKILFAKQILKLYEKS